MSADPADVIGAARRTRAQSRRNRQLADALLTRSMDLRTQYGWPVPRVAGTQLGLDELLALRRRAADAEERAGQLERALVHSRQIAIAIGLVMHAYGVPEGDAFSVLREESRRRGVRLSVVADDVVRAGGLR